MRRAVEVGAATGVLLLLIIILGLSTGVISLNVPFTVAQAAPGVVTGESGGAPSVGALDGPRDFVHLGNGVYFCMIGMTRSGPLNVWHVSLMKFIEDNPTVRILDIIPYDWSYTIITEPRTQ